VEAYSGPQPDVLKPLRFKHPSGTWRRAECKLASSVEVALREETRVSLRVDFGDQLSAESSSASLSLTMSKTSKLTIRFHMVGVSQEKPKRVEYEARLVW